MRAIFLFFHFACFADCALTDGVFGAAFLKQRVIPYNPRHMETTTTTTEVSVLPAIEVQPQQNATAADSVQLPRRPYLDLFLISFLILFFELACIRWFGSTVVFLTFFTN